MSTSQVIPESYQPIRTHYLDRHQDNSPSLEELESDLIALQNRDFPAIFSAEDRDARSDIRSFGEKVSRFFRNLITREGINIRLLSESRIPKSMEKISYSDARDVKIIVPKGFMGPYKDYLEAIEPIAQGPIASLQEDVLDEFLDFLGTMINDPERLRSQRHSGLLETLQQRDIEQHQEKIGEFYGRDQAERRRYGELVGRQSDWKDITKLWNNVVTELQQIPRKTIEDKTEQASDLLETLSEKLDEDPEIYNLSGISAENLTNMSYGVAFEVEFYSIFTYMLEEFGGSLDYCIDELPKRAK